MRNKTALKKLSNGFRPYNHPVLSFIAQQRLQFLSKRIDFDSVYSALDVGCGSGFSTFYLSKYIPCTWGGDRSYAMLVSHPNHDKLVVFDARCLPFINGCFDMVMAWEVLHHIPNPVNALREMRRVTNRYVVLFEPNCFNPGQVLLALLDRDHKRVFHYSMRLIHRLSQEAGLKIEYATKGGWLFGHRTPLWLFHLLKKLPHEFPLGISNIVILRK